MTHWVLIVDDEKATAWALAESLREDGYETAIAHSCGEASARLGERSFDLVITDIRLPDRSGLELLEELAASPTAPPAIVVSAFGGGDVETVIGRLGAHAFFQKPFDVDAVKQVVAVLLAVPVPPGACVDPAAPGQKV
ncbi:MAG: response regulator [Candidatus Eiseniibacteriota bacterium]